MTNKCMSIEFSIERYDDCRYEQQASALENNKVMFNVTFINTTDY